MMRTSSVIPRTTTPTRSTTPKPAGWVSTYVAFISCAYQCPVNNRAGCAYLTHRSRSDVYHLF